ncbi:uncharacterized protein [Amphiura filiformis]|uniref:uncharacterized protein n=1 Tax=Amphiura filiformis TaxID=82378 RepID=UPI003B215072
MIKTTVFWFLLGFCIIRHKEPESEISVVIKIITMAILYACVAAGPRTIIADHSDDYNQNFRAVVYSLLPNISTKNIKKAVFTNNRFYLVELQDSNFIYICITTPEFPEDRSFAFLKDLAQSFTWHNTRLRDSVVDLLELEESANSECSSNTSKMEENAIVKKAKKNFSYLLAEKMVDFSKSCKNIVKKISSISHHDTDESSTQNSPINPLTVSQDPKRKLACIESPFASATTSPISKRKLSPKGSLPVSASPSTKRKLSPTGSIDLSISASPISKRKLIPLGGMFVAPTSSTPTVSRVDSPLVAPTASPSSKRKVGRTRSHVLPTASPFSKRKFNRNGTPRVSPTASPSTKRKVYHTDSPRVSPTASPLLKRKVYHTDSPLVSPTASPLLKRKVYHTDSPLVSPTASPLLKRKVYHTDSPRVSPTASPLLKRKVYHTDSPLVSPTASPSTKRKVHQTDSPLVSPTASPLLKRKVYHTDSPLVSSTASPLLKRKVYHTDSPLVSPKASPLLKRKVYHPGSPLVSPSSSPSFRRKFFRNVPLTSPSVSPSKCSNLDMTSSASPLSKRKLRPLDADMHIITSERGDEDEPTWQGNKDLQDPITAVCYEDESGERMRISPSDPQADYQDNSPTFSLYTKKKEYSPSRNHKFQMKLFSALIEGIRNSPDASPRSSCASSRVSSRAPSPVLGSKTGEQGDDVEPYTTDIESKHFVKRTKRSLRKTFSISPDGSSGDSSPAISPTPSPPAMSPTPSPPAMSPSSSPPQSRRTLRRTSSVPIQNAALMNLQNRFSSEHYSAIDADARNSDTSSPISSSPSSLKRDSIHGIWLDARKTSAEDDRTTKSHHLSETVGLSPDSSSTASWIKTRQWLEDRDKRSKSPRGCREELFGSTNNNITKNPFLNESKGDKPCTLLDDKIQHLQLELIEVEDVVRNTVDVVLTRGENLDDLLERAEDLRAAAYQFKKTNNRLRRRMLWQKRKIPIGIATGILVVLGTIVAVIVIVVLV